MTLAKSPSVPVGAVIFDMDGVLIDSEPLWHEAEMQVFRSLGVPLDEEMCLQTMGLRTDEVVRHWHERFPWQRDLAVVEQELTDVVEAMIRTRGRAKPGVAASLAFVQQSGLPLALASSSPHRLITAVCETLGLESVFSVVHSAEHEALGKPHPAVYLTTAARLDVVPSRCLAIEDSINGIIAAKAARMTCAAVPDAALIGDRRLGIADLVLGSLAELEALAGGLMGGSAERGRARGVGESQES